MSGVILRLSKITQSVAHLFNKGNNRIIGPMIPKSGVVVGGRERHAMSCVVDRRPGNGTAQACVTLK